MHTMQMPAGSSRPILARETVSCGTSSTPMPCLPSNCASMALAASSSGPRPSDAEHGARRLPPFGNGGGIGFALSGRRRLGDSLLGQGEAGRRSVAVAVGGLNVLMLRTEILDQFADRIFDTLDLELIQHATRGVAGRELQAFERDLVVVGRKRPLFQKLVRLIVRLIRIACQHALVEAFDRGQRRAVAQHHVQELQPVHVPVPAPPGTASTAWPATVRSVPTARSKRSRRPPPIPGTARWSARTPWVPPPDP